MLVGQLRDLGLAEDALQDAWLIAADRWAVDGWPDDPGAWILTVARRRALDRIRRETSRVPKERLAASLTDGRHDGELERREERWRSGIDDDRLRLIFVCCHPVLDLDAQLALTLRSVAWLTTDEIASAFGLSPATVAQRIVRAKQRIKDRGTPYRVPSGSELTDRLHGVLRVVYLVFNEAYLSARPSQPVRVDLADEAIRLGRQLVELMPDEPETLGLLGLMLTQHARAAARFDDVGDLVLLEHQDRRRWDRGMIDEATSLIAAALRRRSIGPYQLQAAIAAVHSESATWEGTDWPQLMALYDVLAGIDPSPVVAMNRAVAVGFALGPQAGIDALSAVPEHRLPQPHLLHSARAEMSLRVGHAEQAVEAFARALDVAPSEAERRHLRRRLSDVGRSA